MQKTNNISIIELVKNLKKSPIFNLSLSSKELFHSNFIAWLCEAYPEKFGKILLDYLKPNNQINNKSILSVEREKRKIDLTIEFEDFNLIIENKVKSVPDKEQLIAYKNKSNENDLFLLLTLLEPNFQTDKVGWEMITYDKLIVLLDLLAVEIKENNYYHYNILTDYIYFIKTLTSLIENIKINISDDFYNFYGDIFWEFKKIRLHDLYLKHKYNDLINHIYVFLNEKLHEDIIKKEKRYSHEKNKGEIIITFNLVQGKGVINIDYSNENEIIFGIMLSGDRYNLYLYAWGENLKRKVEIANRLRQEKKWFTFDFVPENQTYPKKGKDYNKFGEMIYRSAKISKDIKLDNLLNQIYTDIIRVKKISRLDYQ